MRRTLEDYATALRQVAAAPPRGSKREDALRITQVDVHAPHLLVSMCWRRYPYPLVHALDLDQVLIYGGDLSKEDTPVEVWASEAIDYLAMVAGSGLTATRRILVGDTIKIIDDTPADPRFYTSHLTVGDVQGWREVSNWADPVIAPTPIENWRSDGSLITWHWAYLQHRYPLPNLGHAATRWQSDGVASLAYLEVVPDVPDTVPLLLAADAIHLAAAAGAHTIVTDIGSPLLDLLGFREINKVRQVDTRFLDIDRVAMTTLVSSTKSWRYPEHIQQAITRASKATYFAG